jgi:hypothetical protein
MQFISPNRSRDVLAVISPDGVRQNRRRAPRVPLSVPAWIWRESASDPIAVNLLDESESGTGIVSPEPLKPGEHFELALGRNGVRRTALSVKYCRASDRNTFRIGAIPL